MLLGFLLFLVIHDRHSYLREGLYVKLLSRVRLFATPWTGAYQAPPPMGFSMQEYWSGLLLPSPVWSHNFMANRWRNSGNSDRLCFGGSKITADGDCSHEIKRHLLLGRKAVTNLDSILKSIDITLLTKVHLVKAMVFPEVMYGDLDCKES